MTTKNPDNTARSKVKSSNTTARRDWRQDGEGRLRGRRAVTFADLLNRPEPKQRIGRDHGSGSWHGRCPAHPAPSGISRGGRAPPNPLNA